MFADKLAKDESSPFFREKASYKPLSPSDDEIYAETEQPGYQCLLLLFFNCSRGYYSL